MSSTNLDNLVKAKQLKSEPPDQNQVDGMIRSARNRLADLESLRSCAFFIACRFAMAWLSLGKSLYRISVFAAHDWS
jgi:hypothetical protein